MLHAKLQIGQVHFTADLQSCKRTYNGKAGNDCCTKRYQPIPKSQVIGKSI